MPDTEEARSPLDAPQVGIGKALYPALVICSLHLVIRVIGDRHTVYILGGYVWASKVL